MPEINNESNLLIEPAVGEINHSQNPVLDQSVPEFSSQPVKQSHKKILFLIAFLVLLLLGAVFFAFTNLRHRSQNDTTTNDSSSADQVYNSAKSALLSLLPGCAIIDEDQNDYTYWRVENDYFINLSQTNKLNFSFFNHLCLIDQSSIESQILPALDRVMLSQGFVLSEVNYNYYRHPNEWSLINEFYIRGYQKDNQVSLISVSTLNEENMYRRDWYPDEPDLAISFYLSDSFAQDYHDQIKILTDLELGGGHRVNLDKRVDDTIYLNVGHIDFMSGSYLIAQLQNDKWVKLIEGQDVPSCELRDRLNIPAEIIDCHSEVAL